MTVNMLCKTKPSSSCCPPACSSSSPCSSCTCSSCSARPDGPDGSHRWRSCRRLCCGSCCWQRYHRDVLRRLLLCTCTCTRTSCPCTSCTCSRAERANRALRLGNQAVPAVQPDPVRHHQLRGFQWGAKGVQAKKSYDSLDFRCVSLHSLDPR